MELRVLNYFLAVAREQSIVRAANPFIYRSQRSPRSSSTWKKS